MKLEDEHKDWSRLKQTFWIKYLFRRCGILAASEKFNKNENLKGFGSTTMAIMLDEVEHALADCFNWNETNHEQFVYLKTTVEGTQEIDYKWSILATNPDSEDDAWKRRVRLLRSLNMNVPTKVIRNNERVY